MSADLLDTLGEPPEHSLIAAEYVLGVLDAEARRIARSRLEHDRAFASDVTAWETRLSPLLARVAPEAPPATLWPRIVAALELGTRAPRAADTKAPADGLWRSLTFWRGLGLSGFAAAAVSFAALFVVLHQQAPTPTLTPALVASMAEDSGRALFVATIDRETGNLVIQPLAVTLPAGRVAELWLIPPGDAPHSLGVVDSAHAQPVVVPASLRGALAPKAIVAVTVEPPGGGPGGKPSGPIIAKGELTTL